MRRVVRCQCGFQAVGVSDDDLVAEAQKHARAAHDSDVSEELILALARPEHRPGQDRPEDG